MVQAENYKSSGDEALVYTDCNSSGCNECGCETFNVELSDKASDENYSRGVSFTTFGNQLKLTYDGQLAKGGASEVFAVVSTRDDTDGTNTSTYHMSNTSLQRYELSIPLQKNRQISVSFKDNSENRDDNSGKSYSYYIQ